MNLATIGHSTRSIDDFIAILQSHGIRSVADVRRFPGSRRHPQFSRESLADSLRDADIVYRHFESLGGRRRPSPDSPNVAWRNASFRAYADYMASREFHDALDEAISLPRPIAFLCAEAVPWRCHRNLIADELTRRGSTVHHILSRERAEAHTLNRAAVDRGTHLVYNRVEDGGQVSLPFSAT